MFASGCTGYPPPTETEVKAFLLQSRTFAPANDEGRLRLNSFELTSGKSKNIAGMELYKATFTANISISIADCENHLESDCGKDTVQAREITGTAEFLWENDHWSKAGLELSN